jgi:hypothetical protein
MDRREARRLALKALVDSKGRGGVAAVAAKIGKAPDYVARMLYEPGKDGKKGIGEQTWDILVAAYPKELRATSDSLMAASSKGSGPESQIAELQRQVESLAIVLGSVIGVAGKHRPLEGAEISRVIRGNQSLDLSRHELVGYMLEMLDQAEAKSAKPTARARK